MWSHRDTRTLRAATVDTEQSVATLQRQVHLQSALHARSSTDRSYPESIDPGWFEKAVPRNALLTDARPWLEIASDSERARTHPQSLIAACEADACFWYNPWNGIVRARVPADLADALALDIYNQVNGAHLTDLFFDRQD